nr:unnamed protein product [Callosobruchus chinensis]
MEMLENLIHWNINGIKSKYCDLKSLITSYGPFCLALQETHLRPSDTFTLRGYKTFRKDAVSYDRACGGVITLIRDSIQASEVTLNTSLQSTAVKIHYPLKQLKPEIGKTIIYPSQMTQREQSVCTRLRIGHTRLTLSYLFTWEEPPVCFISDLQLTVQHIIAESPAYEAERWLYQISDDLIETLNASPRRTKALLLWLQSTGLFNKI